MNHRHEQIGEKHQRDDANDDRFHSNLLEFLAKADVKSAYDKKRNNDSTEDQIIHRIVIDGTIRPDLQSDLLAGLHPLVRATLQENGVRLVLNRKDDNTRHNNSLIN